MNRVREGTRGYVYPSSTWAREVRLGTPPFRGVPRVPSPETDLLGHEIQTPKRHSRPEAAALLEVLQALRAHPAVAWCHRVNTGAAKVGNRFIRFGWPGCPDVLGQLKDGRLLGVEVKAPRGRLRPEQAQFLDCIRRARGVAFVARDCRDVHRELALC